MTDEIEVPKSRPWLFALGASLALGAVVLWYLRKPCDCEKEPEQRPDSPVGDAETHLARRRAIGREALQRIRSGAHPGATAVPEPEADPLAWDTHARDAWGLNVGGPRTLDAWAASSNGSDEPEEQEQYHQN